MTNSLHAPTLKAKPLTMEQSASLVGAILLLPGFVIYQIFLYSGQISPFLGGYTGIAGLFVSILLLPIYIYSIYQRKIKIQYAEYLFFSFLFLILLVSVYYTSDLNRNESSIAKLSSIPMTVSFYFIFRMISFNKNSTKIVFFFSMAICAMAMNFLSLGQVSADNLIINIDEDLSESIANYQFFALVYVICFLSVVPMISYTAIRFMVYGVSIWVLFINGARSEFIAVFIAIFSMEIALSKYKLFIASIIFIFSILLYLNSQLFVQNEFANARSSSLFSFSNVTDDASYLERGYASDVAIANIVNNPFTGDFSNHELGLYAHNIVGTWADFGIVGFLLFVVILITMIRMTIALYLQTFVDKNSVAFATTAIAGTLLFVFAKAYTYPLLGMMVALQAAQLSRSSMSEFETQRLDKSPY